LNEESAPSYGGAGYSIHDAFWPPELHTAGGVNEETGEVEGDIDTPFILPKQLRQSYFDARVKDPPPGVSSFEWIARGVDSLKDYSPNLLDFLQASIINDKIVWIAPGDSKATTFEEKPYGVKPNIFDFDGRNGDPFEIVTVGLPIVRGGRTYFAAIDKQGMANPLELTFRNGSWLQNPIRAVTPTEIFPCGDACESETFVIYLETGNELLEVRLPRDTQMNFPDLWSSTWRMVKDRYQTRVSGDWLQSVWYNAATQEVVFQRMEGDRIFELRAKTERDAPFSRLSLTSDWKEALYGDATDGKCRSFMHALRVYDNEVAGELLQGVYRPNRGYFEKAFEECPPPGSGHWRRLETLSLW